MDFSSIPVNPPSKIYLCDELWRLWRIIRLFSKYYIYHIRDTTGREWLVCGVNLSRESHADTIKDVRKVCMEVIMFGGWSWVVFDGEWMVVYAIKRWIMYNFVGGIQFSEWSIKRRRNISLWCYVVCRYGQYGIMANCIKSPLNCKMFAHNAITMPLSLVYLSTQFAPWNFIENSTILELCILRDQFD